MLKVCMKGRSFCTKYNHYRTHWTTEHSSGQEVGNIFKGFRQAKEQFRKLLILVILIFTSAFKY